MQGPIVMSRFAGGATVVEDVGIDSVASLYAVGFVVTDAGFKEELNMVLAFASDEWNTNAKKIIMDISM